MNEKKHVKTTCSLKDVATKEIKDKLNKFSFVGKAEDLADVLVSKTQIKPLKPNKDDKNILEIVDHESH